MTSSVMKNVELIHTTAEIELMDAAREWLTNPTLSRMIRNILQINELMAIFEKTCDDNRLIIVRFCLSEPKFSYTTIVTQRKGPNVRIMRSKT